MDGVVCFCFFCRFVLLSIFRSVVLVAVRIGIPLDSVFEACFRCG